jgi:hypothetical protein
MKGLQGKTEFGDYLTAVERKVLGRLAEIEQEDADRCVGCGGEDCICCEYYLDRQKWSSPEGLFYHEPGDPMYDDFFFGKAVYDDEEEEEWEE